MRTRNAFTLIELLVVIAVLAILIAALLPSLAGVRRAAAQTQSLSDMRQIGSAAYSYADTHHNTYYPTARMPGRGPNIAPFTDSWVYLVARELDHTLPMLVHTDAAPITPPEISDFIARADVFRSPADPSTNWDDPAMPRLGSYGINAYVTPNHPPYDGVKLSNLRRPSQLILAVELTENLGSDHIMPMYWGDPPAVSNAMIESRQWDKDTRLPKGMAHDRHAGDRSNILFADGHAAPHTFAETWIQEPGDRPELNRYEAKRP